MDGQDMMDSTHDAPLSPSHADWQPPVPDTLPEVMARMGWTLVEAEGCSAWVSGTWRILTPATTAPMDWRDSCELHPDDGEPTHHATLVEALAYHDQVA